MSEAQDYIDGWQACMSGLDGRYLSKSMVAAFCAGFTDAMEAEDGEQPDPACAGYGDES